MKVTIIIESDELGDLRVSRDEEESRKNPEKQFLEILEELTTKAKRAYDLLDPY